MTGRVHRALESVSQALPRRGAAFQSRRNAQIIKVLASEGIAVEFCAHSLPTEESPHFTSPDPNNEPPKPLAASPRHSLA